MRAKFEKNIREAQDSICAAIEAIDGTKFRWVPATVRGVLFCWGRARAVSTPRPTECFDPAWQRLLAKAPRTHWHDPPGRRACRQDAWTRESGGGGITRVMQVR
jgi:coproporphyrinogen III oxidase